LAGTAEKPGYYTMLFWGEKDIAISAIVFPVDFLTFFYQIIMGILAVFPYHAAHRRSQLISAI